MTEHTATITQTAETAQASERRSGRERWRFAASRRWFGYLALLVAFGIACGFLSHWQFDRREEKVEANARITNNFDRDPQPLADVLPAPGDFAPDQEWTPVVMHGSYLPGDQLLARARPFDGRPGFEILTPFRGDDGRILVVDRGWLPVGSAQDAPDSVPAPPAGQVSVVARLRPGEPEIPGRSAPAGQIATINLPTFAETLGPQTYTAAYGLLSAEQPSAETGQLAPKPALDEGNHLSYAFQWIIFALIGLAGLVWGVWNEYRHRNADDPRVVEAMERAKARRARKRTDADIEDELLDARR